MNTTLLLRIASVITLLFAVGHTVGAPWTPAGEAAPASVVEAMKSVSFDAMGSKRTFWDFYFGFGVSISIYLVVQAAVLWFLAAFAKTQAASIRPLLACSGSLRASRHDTSRSTGSQPAATHCARAHEPDAPACRSCYLRHTPQMFTSRGGISSRCQPFCPSPWSSAWCSRWRRQDLALAPDNFDQEATVQGNAYDFCGVPEGNLDGLLKAWSKGT